jgi:hypothetical protein
VTAKEGTATPDPSPPEGQSSNDSSDDEDVIKYIVELKLPRRQNLQLNRRLRDRNDQAKELVPNGDAPVLAGEDSPESEESNKLAGPLTDLVETQEDTCTSANWMSYFLYMQQKQGDEPYVNCDSDEFDDDVSSKATKAFTLRKPYQGAIGLTISSPYIREHLLRAIGIEFYNGVAIGASHTVLDWPFSPLYHHLGDIRADVHNDPNATKTERNDIDALHYFVTEGAPAKLYEDIRSKIAQGFITYDELWALFRPGDLAVVKDPVGNDDIAQIVSVKLERNPRGSIHGPQYLWYITLLKIAWKGNLFRRVSTRWRMDIFTGSRKILDLQICPLWSRNDRNSLRDTAIQQGKLWKKHCEGEPTTMLYDGQGLSLLTEEPLRQDYTYEREGVFESEYNTFNV